MESDRIMTISLSTYKTDRQTDRDRQRDRQTDRQR